MWFTSAYLIAVASMSPLVGRLAMVFSPGVMTLTSSLFFTVGALVSSQAMSFAVFILGRVLVGVGGAGVMTLSMILVLQLTSKRRRGLFIGLVNAGFTIGLSTGAVVFGALLPTLGWVSNGLADSNLELNFADTIQASTIPSPSCHWVRRWLRRVVQHTTLCGHGLVQKQVDRARETC